MGRMERNPIRQPVMPDGSVRSDGSAVEQAGELGVSYGTVLLPLVHVMPVHKIVLGLERRP